MNIKSISIGCDHAGFPHKDPIKAMLTEMGIAVKDYGTHSLDSVDYPDFVHPVANDVDSVIVIKGSARSTKDLRVDDNWIFSVSHSTGLCNATISDRQF
jgi:ribose 5-phosphate isomerase B